MPRDSAVYEVMIASPSDVVSERSILADVIDDWNSAHSRTRGISLQALRWELDGVPATGARPQAILNKQLVKGADILFAVFRARIGTPTGAASSGTTEEIEEFRAQGKPVLLYFSEGNIPHNHDPEQFRLLNEYRSKLSANTLYSTFINEEDLRRKATRDLANTVNGITPVLAVSAANQVRVPKPDNAFARVALRKGNTSFSGVRTVNIFGEIQNISQNRRLGEYSCTLVVPKDCISFSGALYAAEIKSDDPNYRKFRCTEQSHGNAQILPWDTAQVISIEIAVGHLSPDVRTKCLSMPLRAQAIVEGEALEIVKRVDDFIGS